MFSSNTASNSLSAPGIPGIGAAYANGQSSGYVYYTAPASTGGSPITSYTAVAFSGSTPVSSATIAAPGPGYIYVYGLASETTYRMAVYATNAVGNSDYSAFSNYFTTDSPPAPEPLLVSLDSGYQSWSFNVPYGAWVYLTLPIYCYSGSGYYTVQETSRPSSWSVSVNGVLGGPLSGGGTGTATANLFTYNGNTNNVTIGVYPANINTFSGTFAIVPPYQSNIIISWTGTGRLS
jgi:hypothetical protein